MDDYIDEISFKLYYMGVHQYNYPQSEVFCQAFLQKSCVIPYLKYFAADSNSFMS